MYKSLFQSLIFPNIRLSCQKTCKGLKSFFVLDLFFLFFSRDLLHFISCGIQIGKVNDNILSLCSARSFASKSKI